MASNVDQSLDPESLYKWLKDNNIKLVLTSGQRTYGGPPDVWPGPTPGEGCEILITNIPQDIHENVLIPLFSSVGPLWEFTLMLGASGKSLGFAFAKFGSATVAETARRLLHNHRLASGVCLSVHQSSGSRQLCLGKLPLGTRTKYLSRSLGPERLFDKWLKDNKIKLVLTSGQRTYGGPPDAWPGPTPGEGCEVLITNIPQDIHENVLIPLFSSVGPLWEFTLMLGASGKSLGFAFAKFVSATVAETARRLLHNHRLASGVCLSVHQSSGSRQLCLGKLPQGTTTEYLSSVLHELTEGVESVSLVTCPDVGPLSVAVVFSSYQAAAVACGTLVEAFRERYSLAVAVKWQLSPCLSGEDIRPPQLCVDVPPPAPSGLPRDQRSSDGLTELHPSVLHSIIFPHCHSPHPVVLRASLFPPSLLFPPVSKSPPSNPRWHAVNMYKMSSMSKLCEVFGEGLPHFQLQYRSIRADGFLEFNYRLFLQGPDLSFSGLVLVLPAHSLSVIEEEACRAAVEQILKLSS